MAEGRNVFMKTKSALAAMPAVQLDAASSVRLGLLNHSTELSGQWFDRAKRVLAGGISSSARSTSTGDLPYPLYLTRGQGSRVWDADDNQFIDYLLSYGSIPIGHADRQISQILSAQLERGTMFGTCNPQEVELAELICRMVPCAQLVRYANSGSEAMCGAIRAARGFTGKTKILKFEGHYHGWVDVLAVSNRPTPAEAGPADEPFSAAHSRGTPASVVAEVIICPWNDPAALKHILDKHAGEFAAVVAEPIVANNACIMPDRRLPANLARRVHQARHCVDLRRNRHRLSHLARRGAGPFRRHSRPGRLQQSAGWRLAHRRFRWPT